MMVLTASRDLNDTFAEHLEALRGYAKRVLIRGDALTDAEQLDERTRISRLVTIGHTFRLTDKEMVELIFKGILRGRNAAAAPPAAPVVNPTASSGVLVPVEDRLARGGRIE